MSQSDEDADFIILLYDAERYERSETKMTKRRIFEKNLKQMFLILEYTEDRIRIKIPEEILLRYCEALKIRLPINEGLFINTRGTKKRSFLSRALRVGLSSYIWTAEYTRNENMKDIFVMDICFTHSMKAMIINYILQRQSFTEDRSGVGIGLLEGHVYYAAYPPHEGSCNDPDSKRGQLVQNWASFQAFFKYQPIDDIADYLGYKIALYYSWTGYYTSMLIFPSLIGFLVVIYGAFSVSNHQITKEACSTNHSVVMCPACDNCPYRKLEDVCDLVKLVRIVDNDLTVPFSLLMCIWSAFFVKFWKRHSAQLIHRWGLSGFDTMFERPRPQYLIRCRNMKKEINEITNIWEPIVPYWTIKLPRLILSYIITFLLVIPLNKIIHSNHKIFLTFQASFILLTCVCHILIDAIFELSERKLRDLLTKSLIRLVFIRICNRIYNILGTALTNGEYQRTQSDYDNSLVTKIFIFQFITYYSPPFYTALIAGKFVGYPNNYNRIFGYRQNECHPAACMIESAITLGIIMVGDQIVDNLIDFVFFPLCERVKQEQNRRKFRFGSFVRHIPRFITAMCQRSVWNKDEDLVHYTNTDYIFQYLKMVIQYGFVLLFVPAFPLAPFFAWLQNLVTIRLDSIKLLRYYRRPVCQREESIHIWCNIIEVLSRISTFSNALTIALNSTFIALLLSRTAGVSFFSYTLSIYEPSDPLYPNVTECWYPGKRYPPGHRKQYRLRDEYWTEWFYKILFAGTFFVVISLIRLFVQVAVSDVPADLAHHIKAESHHVRSVMITKSNRSARTQSLK